MHPYSIEPQSTAHGRTQHIRGGVLAPAGPAWLSSPPPAAGDGRHEISVIGPAHPDSARVLTPAALSFVRRMSEAFEPRRRQLLERRRERQLELDDGRLPDFLPHTFEVRAADWLVAPIPQDLEERRVEITGPVDRKMIINALNSGANVFMADFEDSTAPTWDNIVGGQTNLIDAVRGSISYSGPDGREYALKDRVATLLVRPRGWHLDEKHVLVNGRPISASLLDFGLFFFHNAQAQLARGCTPAFYLPKLESHLEARLWNDVFVWAQAALDIPRGTIRATVLIETILAAFETDEILYELREHSAGLNCGRWDYIFSLIKKLQNHPRFVLPDRALVTMTSPFMRSYSLLTIRTCHRRGIHAMGGMAAQIPIRDDPIACAAAVQKVRDDKAREVADGHDGTWVAHPGLIKVAQEQFERMSGPHQIARQRDDVRTSAQDLLAVAENPRITEAGVRTNIAVGLRYLQAWLGGQGCVAINNLMEDAATAEICRAQLWQWVHHAARLDDGRAVNLALVERLLDDEVDAMSRCPEVAQRGHERLALARALFAEMTSASRCPEFLTSAAYQYL